MISKELIELLDFIRATLGYKWSSEVILVLGDGDPLRFTEIHDNLPGCSTKVLSEILKKLEYMGFITRTSYNEVPPKVTYHLSELGLAYAKHLEDRMDFYHQLHSLYKEKQS